MTEVNNFIDKKYEPSFTTPGGYYYDPTSEAQLPTTNLRKGGRGIEIESQRVVKFTKHVAVELLEQLEVATSDGETFDRKLRDNHVNYLLRCAKSGTFRPEWVTLMSATFAGKVYRINGQHCCWMRLEMDDDWDAGEVKWLRYRVRSEYDLRQLYASVDRNAPRTPGHVTTAYLVGQKGFEGVGKKILRLLASGWDFWKLTPLKRSHTYGKLNPEEVAFALMNEGRPLVALVLASIGGKESRENRHILRRSVMGACFATCEASAKVASEEFWPAVISGANLPKNDARLQLRNYLLTSQVRGASASRIVSDEEMFGACISSWNAFMEGRGLANIRRTEGRPKVRERRKKENT